MTDQVDPDPILERYLAEHHDAFVRDLAAALDLDAGLRDATLPARHTRLIEDVRGVLDLEAGLAAVLPGSLGAPSHRQTHSPGTPQESTRLEAASIEWESDLDRLEFRAHTASPQACSCTEVRIAVLTSVYAMARAIQSALDTSPVSSEVFLTVHELTAALERSIDKFDRALVADLDNFRYMANKIVSALSADDASRNALTLAEDLAEQLDALERVMNDFTDSDLENANLHDINLSGIRWSNRTKWPNEWVDLIRRTSVEIEPGIFLIRNDDLFARN